MLNFKVRLRPVMLLLFIFLFLVSCYTFIAHAQFFYPILYPFPAFTGFSPFPAPIIRHNPFQSYPRFLNTPFVPPSRVFPLPVTRQAATTISIFTTTTLIVYNPSLLLGPNSASVTPSPLLSLLAGQLLVFGASPLNTANPALFNYLANTYLLPTGLTLFFF